MNRKYNHALETRKKAGLLNWLYVIIPVMANLLAVIVMNGFLVHLVFTPSEQKAIITYLAKIPQYLQLLYYITTNVLSFIVPTSLIVIYAGPLNRYYNGKSDTFLPQRVLNFPLMISLISFSGWIVAFIAQSLLNFSLEGISIYHHLKNLNLFALTSMFIFVLTYYSLDFVNRRFMIPLLFTDSVLSDIPGTLSIPIRARFYIFFFSATVFPLAMNMLYLFSIGGQMAENGINMPVLPLALSLFVIVGLVLIITNLIALSFEKPIIAMQKAAKSIENGVLNIKVPVESPDETGRLGESINSMARGLEEKERIRDAFGKIVDPKVRDHLLSGNMSLGGEMKVATVLFSDIRGFTALSENMLPDAVVALLNRYFEAMYEAITANRGLLNKYIGDAVLALFGLPLEDPRHAENALRAARDMIKARDTLNISLKSEGLPVIRTGIGIHSGLVVAGNIGARARMEYTAIGDTVNVASRLESLCKETEKEILITESSRMLMSDITGLKELESYKIRGRSEAIKVFTV